MKRFRRNKQEYGDYHAQQAVWMLRLILQHHRMFRAIFHSKKGYNDEDIALFLELPEFNEETCKPNKTQLKKAMHDKLIEFESKICNDLPVHHNIALLASRLELNAVEKDLLCYAVMVEDCNAWDDLFRLAKVESEQQLMLILATMLDVGLQDIKQVLRKKAFLRQSGLIDFSKNYTEDAKVELLDELSPALQADNDDVNDLLAYFLKPSPPSKLTMDKYPHAKADISMIQPMLKQALAEGDCGVNILLYGSPGTGKTELARLLASTLDCQLFEVKTEDDDGDAIRSCQRLSSYRLSQQLLNKDKKSLIIFDEVEDVFPARSFSFFGIEMKSGENKGWMNKTLEENGTPAIWVCNQVQQIDAAFLRRFDYVMELNTPPKHVRLEIAKSYLQDKPVSEDFLQRIASHEKLSPAQVEKLGKVVQRLDVDELDMDRTLERVVNNSLRAMSLKPLAKTEKEQVKYDVGYLNTNVDMVSMIEGLKRSKQGNICFYGAPGTGKTALAAYIAKELDVPLISKKTSDILGMYVGESEQNIAQMFADATDASAVLVLDEADSLLRDRRGANQSWEVTQVNELLVQMENFEGLFFCSTNLMDDLDQASLRRFALKVKFDYLSCEQALRMFEHECVGDIPQRVKKELLTLDNLAPGDFAAVKKRLKILGKKLEAEELLYALKDEVSIKEPHTKKSIGFM